MRLAFLGCALLVALAALGALVGLVFLIRALVR
jgi:hypothetical protein